MPSGLVVHTFMLVIPDDRGGLGFTEVGKGVWYRSEYDSGRTITIDCFAPVSPGGTLRTYTFAGRSPWVWRLLANWLGYAVVAVDGSVVIVPQKVWQYERRSNIWAGEHGLDPFAEMGL